MHFTYPSDKLLIKKKELVASDRMIRGLGATYNYRDRDRDNLASDAFKESIEEAQKTGLNIPYLLLHDGDRYLGSIQKIENTEEGVYFEAFIIETKIGNKFLSDIDKGVIFYNSVGFGIEEGKYDIEEKTYNIFKADLFEISAVTVPANPQAVINKSLSIDYSTYFYIKQILTSKESIKTKTAQISVFLRTQRDIQNEYLIKYISKKFNLPKL